MVSILTKHGTPLLLLALLQSSVVHAETFKEIVSGTISPLIDSFVAFAITLAVVAFVFGMVRFIATAGDDKSRASGKTLMVWGLVALLIILSVWGVVEVVYNTFFGGA
jgi:succinate dehydrogenase/fumarate reductase cytochrome b subunit